MKGEIKLSTSRRGFLKKSAIVGAGAALQGLPGLAVPIIALKGAAPDAPTIPVGESQAAVSARSATNEFTRGLGVYPGDPRENFSPELVVDKLTYRNLALLRPAYHSSSYDYNLTAQLITDGIRETHLPEWVATSTNSRGALPKNERELVLDHSRTNSVEIFGPRSTLQIQLGGGESVPEVDRIDVVVVPPFGTTSPNLSFTASVSEDGRDWEEVGSVSGPQPVSVEGYPRDFARPGQLFIPSISLSRVCRSRFYQVEFAVSTPMPQAFYMQWKVGEIEFFRDDRESPNRRPL